MATLSIRNLPDEDHEALRLRAAHHGVSMGAEARAILHRALCDAAEAGAIRRSHRHPLRARAKRWVIW